MFRRAHVSLIAVVLIACVGVFAQQPAIPTTGFAGLDQYRASRIAVFTDDFGQPPILGGFRSRVFGVGPQLGYIFPIGDNQAFLGVKGYGEFDAANRPSGWNTWLTFAISEAAPKTVTPTRHLVTK